MQGLLRAVWHVDRSLVNSDTRGYYADIGGNQVLHCPIERLISGPKNLWNPKLRGRVGVTGYKVGAQLLFSWQLVVDGTDAEVGKLLLADVYHNFDFFGQLLVLLDF